MKKTIALFSVAALALTFSLPAFAGNSFLGGGSDVDDSTFVQNSTVYRTFKVKHVADADIDNYLYITSNSGGNTLWAGDDLDQGSISAGGASVDASENSDVNGLTVDYEPVISGSGSNGIDLETNANFDDTTVVQNETLGENEDIDSDTWVDDYTFTDVTANSGGNTAGGGGDVGEDGPVTIGSGATSVGFDRTLWRNVIQIIRRTL